MCSKIKKYMYSSKNYKTFLTTKLNKTAASLLTLTKKLVTHIEKVQAQNSDVKRN